SAGADGAAVPEAEAGARAAVFRAAAAASAAAALRDGGEYGLEAPRPASLDRQARTGSDFPQGFPGTHHGGHRGGRKQASWRNPFRGGSLSARLGNPAWDQ